MQFKNKNKKFQNSLINDQNSFNHMYIGVKPTILSKLS